MVSSKLTDQQQTIAGYSASTGILLYGGFGAAGLIVGYFLPRIAAWALKLPWLPFQGPLKLIDTFNGPWLSYILSLLGLIAGFVVAYIAIKESLIVSLTDQEVQLDQNGHKQTIAHRDIGMVFMDGRHLVILGKSGQELAREKSEESAAKAANDFSYAFVKHGYPWAAKGDPYKEEYRRWVPDTPDISAAANAVLKAREIALQKKVKEEIKDLRKELNKMGFIIRDEETRQYWRQVPGEITKALSPSL